MKKISVESRRIVRDFERNLRKIQAQILPQWLSSNESACSVGDLQEIRVRSLTQEDTLQQEMATHSSILPWKIPQTEEPCGLHTVHEVAKSWTRLSD